MCANSNFPILGVRLFPVGDDVSVDGAAAAAVLQSASQSVVTAATVSALLNQFGEARQP